MNFLDKLLEYIFLPSCGICQKLGEGYLCKKCEKEIDKQKLDLYYKNKETNVESFFVFKYKGIVRDKLISYKFQDKAYLYKMFAQIIIEDQKACEFVKAYDIIIPVPIHKKRKSLRGYNQSELVATELSKKLKMAIYKDVLIKTSNNKAQSTLNKKSRAKNVKDVYKLINQEKIINKNVLIFDDIYTTGATVNECISMLANAGAKKIGVLIIAKD